MRAILNISAYKFVSLGDPQRFRADIHANAQSHSLRGTVLLADEGINLFLAGAQPDVRGFLAWLRALAVFADLPVKESWSDAMPFRKLLVKVKREIIRMDHPTVRPQAGRAPTVDAATLARWLDAGVDDAGREVVTLDTRNAFEVEHGRLHGAHHWRLGKFSEFPQALRTHRAELDGKTVVSYCTGGIRCEKAALLMADAGVANVLQLDGGILKFLEDGGGRHFEGNCFVFDAREALTYTLEPVATTKV
ncbi:MAG: sulfurtransferase [Burkholderiaceae bacterium]